jgi:anti-sigma regulatory factor (Ser/Thr protein kinase)
MTLVQEKAEASGVESRTFPADRTAPRAATSWLRSLPLPLSESRFSDAELCVDELVTNVVRYAWAEKAGRFLTLRVARSGSDVAITVEDDGRPFDPSDAPIAAVPHSLDEAVPGGRGLMLVRSIAPEVRYERTDGVNRVTIRFPV